MSAAQKNNEAAHLSARRLVAIKGLFASRDQPPVGASVVVPPPSPELPPSPEPELPPSPEPELPPSPEPELPPSPDVPPSPAWQIMIVMLTTGIMYDEQTWPPVHSVEEAHSCRGRMRSVLVGHGPGPAIQFVATEAPVAPQQIIPDPVQSEAFWHETVPIMTPLLAPVLEPEEVPEVVPEDVPLLVPLLASAEPLPPSAGGVAVSSPPQAAASAIAPDAATRISTFFIV